jgi:hypothetical protein
MTQSEKPADGTAAMAVSNPTSSFSLERYYEERLENVRRNLPEAARELKEAGVATVRIEYDGCGDSGQIESVSYLDRDGKALEFSSTASFSEDRLTDLFYDLTQARHPGWENNDGAFGEFDWNLNADTLRHEHNDRFTDYETTEHEGL